MKSYTTVGVTEKADEMLNEVAEFYGLSKAETAKRAFENEKKQIEKIREETGKSSAYEVIKRRVGD